MSLADGAQALGLTANGARSRFKAGKIKGERDNRGRIWIWVDEAVEGSKRPRRQPSTEGVSNSSIEGAVENPKPSVEHASKAETASEGHIRTLTEQLARALNELADVRIWATNASSAASRLEGKVEGLEALTDELRTDRDQWRQMALERQTAPEAVPSAANPPHRRGLFGFLGRAA
jgi:hypothetical protein